MGNRINFKYIRSKVKKNPFNWIKEIVYLIPIFSIIAMFSTAMSINKINQIQFLKKSNFKNIAFTEKPIGKENEFIFVKSIAATDKETINNQNLYKNKRIMALYIMEANKKYDFNKTFFGKQNFLRGSLEKITNYESKISIALDYKSLKKLNLNVGDVVSILLPPNYYELKCSVGAILFPMNNDKDGTTGIGLITGEKLESILKQQQIQVSYATFLNEEVEKKELGQNYEVINKDEWLNSYENLINFKDKITVNILFPLMGMILIYLVINREIKFILKREQKNISILSMLGANNNSISYMFAFEQFIIIVISAFISTLVYKYILFERFIKDYITLINFIGVFLGCALLGTICILINIYNLRKKLSSISVVEILTTREL